NKNSLKKEMIVSNQEFIRRFSLHILPKRFVKIRHYGILSSSWKRGKLQALQSDLKIKIPEVTPKTLLNKCRCCKTGDLVTIAVFGQRGSPPEYLFVAQPVSANEPLRVREIMFCNAENLKKTTPQGYQKPQKKCSHSKKLLCVSKFLKRKLHRL